MSELKCLIGKIEKIADVLVLELSPAGGRPVFDFKPGQYAMISYVNAKGLRQDKHAFSLASSPHDKSHIRFGIKILGKFTQGLAELKPGDEIFVTGPFGKFVFDEKKYHDLVLIAGGIGITPFLSAIEYATANNLPNRISLFYSNKTLAGTLFFDEIRKLEKNNKNLRSLFCLTDDKPYPKRKYIFSGRVNGRIISNFTGPISGKTFFICGPANFMAAVKEVLIGLGVEPGRIEIEQFTMIPDAGFLARIKNISYAAGFSALVMLLPFYLIYRSSEAPLLDKKSVFSYLFSSYDSTKLYSLAQQAYDEMSPPLQADAGSPEPKNQNSASGKLPVAADNLSDDSGENVRDAVSAAAVKAGLAPKPVAKANSAAKTAPTVKKVSVSAPLKNNKAAVSAPKNQSAPSPVTSASIPASESAAVTSTNQAALKAPAPSPITSASAPVSTPAPVQIPVSSNPAVATPAPSPITSASGVVSTPAPAPTPTTPTSSIPATTTPAPSPITSASGVISNPTSNPAQSPIVSTPAPAPQPANATTTTGRQRDDDD